MIKVGQTYTTIMLSEWWFCGCLQSQWVLDLPWTESLVTR